MASSYQFSGGSSTSGQQVLPGMMNVYNDLLNRNQGVYNQILSGYSEGQNRLGNVLPQIDQGYSALSQGVMNTLGLGGGGWGVAAPAVRAIQERFLQQQGTNRQNLINAGLGNTTVAASLANQNTNMAANAYANLGAQLADKAAGYQSQLGLAQQAARMQGLSARTGLTQNLLGVLGGYRFANTAGSLYGPYSTSTNYSSGSSSGGGGGGGYGGGGGGGASPGGAASAVNATGAIPFGTAGERGGGMGYSGGYSYGSPKYDVPTGGGSSSSGGYGRSLWDLADMSQGDINAMGTSIWDYADLSS